MNTLKVLIVDDEPLAHKVIEGYCEKIDFIEVLGNCYDGFSTLNFLNINKVDVLLLDIQMPDLTGLELLDSLKENIPKVIFTTAFTDYAINGFDYDQVVDYLHKPFRITRFIKAIERVRKVLLLENDFQQQLLLPTNSSTPVTINNYICLKENKIQYRIHFEEIIYIQSWGNYLKFFLVKQKVIMVRKTIKTQELELPAHLFQRIHKSYIINIRHVKAIEGNMILMDSIKLPISKSYLIMTKNKLTVG